ncbi:MAG TPA: hypothetical protein VNT51_01295 [Miltoncostaeaceae bacterium]|nr:hypothetical protein [Miltoncostaeaceae bacterium]
MADDQSPMYPRETADPGGRNLTPDAVRGGPTDGTRGEDAERGDAARRALPEDAVIPEGADAQTSAGSGGQARYEGIRDPDHDGARGPGGDVAPNMP